MHLKVKSILLAFIFVSGSSSSVRGEEGKVRYIWDPFLPSERYQVIVKTPEKEDVINTQETSLILDEGAEVIVEVYDKFGRFVTNAKVEQKPVEEEPELIGDDEDEPATKIMHEWEAVDGANYYLGLIKERSGKRYFVMTRDTRIWIEDNVELLLRAYDDRRKYFELVKELPPMNEETSEDDRRPPPEPPRVLTPEEKEEIKAIEELEDERREAFVVEPYREFSAALMIGAEKMKSEGGLSELDGSTKVGGGNLKLRVDLAQFELGSYWPSLILVKSDLHNYNTSQEKKLQNTDTESSPISYRRLYFTANGLWTLFAYEQGKIFGGAGFGMMELPYPEISNETTGESSFSSQSSYGLNLELALEHHVTEINVINLELSILPITIGGDVKSASAIHFLLGSKYYLTPVFFSKFDVKFRSESGTRDVDCPSGISDCNSSGKSSALTTFFNLGIGIFF